MNSQTKKYITDLSGKIFHTLTNQVAISPTFYAQLLRT
jgi:hypothetical protein